MNLVEAIERKYESKEPGYDPIVRTTMTVKEVAEYLGLSTDLVYKLVRQKKIPFIKVGSRILFKMASIEKWLNELEYTPE